ncbi:MAG TPA: SHOCT domain-containing protein [Streptosporangiaceae bacterium]
MIAKIRELGELKQQGLLSDEEFAALKAKIIATA